jgi:hypothetical protein
MIHHNPEEGERKYGDVEFADSVNNKYPVTIAVSEGLVIENTQKRHGWKSQRRH